MRPPRLPILLFCCGVGCASAPPAAPDSRTTREETLKRARAEIAKYASPGYRAAIALLERMREEDCASRDAIPLLSLSYGLWACERKELGLPNVAQWVEAEHYARLSGDTNEALKTRAVALHARNLLDEHEWAEWAAAFRRLKGWQRGESPDGFVKGLSNVFRLGPAGHGAEAVALLDAALERAPGDTEARLLRWWVDSAGVEESEDLAEVLRRDPRCVLPAYEIATAKAKMSQLREAQKWLEETLERNPDHPRALADLGAIAAKQGLEQQARDLLSRALALEPELPRAHLDLGSIRLDRGESAEAEEALKKASALRPGWGEPLNLLATALADEERWADAIEVLDTLVDLADSHEVEATVLRAAARLALGQLDEAEADARRAIAFQEDAGLPHTLLGLVKLKKSDAGSAASSCGRAASIGGGTAEAHLCLGEAASRLGEREKARSAVKRAAELFGERLTALAERIGTEREKGHERLVLRLEKERKRTEEKKAACERLLE